MGESKRRKEQMGEKYGQEPALFPWLPVTKKQADQFVTWSIRATWLGIGGLIAWWVTVRFIGPALGWWNVVG